MTVTEARCSKRHTRIWWAIGLLFAAVLGVGPTIYSLYGVTYEAKAEAKNAQSDTEKLEVKVDAQGGVLEEIQKDVRETRQDVKTLLRNGGGD